MLVFFNWQNIIIYLFVFNHIITFYTNKLSSLRRHLITMLILAYDLITSQTSHSNKFSLDHDTYSLVLSTTHCQLTCVHLINHSGLLWWSYLSLLFVFVLRCVVLELTDITLGLLTLFVGKVSEILNLCFLGGEWNWHYFFDDIVISILL